MPTGGDDYTEEALARAFAMEGKGRKWRRRRKWSAPAPNRTRAWSSTAGTAVGAGPATRPAAAPEPPLPTGAATEEPTLTLADFLDGLPYRG
jgi:hypothetical protein